MCGRIISIILCLSTVLGVYSSVLPVQKCKLSNSACLKTEFQKAVPVFMDGINEYGVEVMDELKIDFLKFDVAGLQFTVADSRMKGMRSLIIDSVEWDTMRQKIDVTFHILVGIMNGHYTANGTIFILPIIGDGNLFIEFDDLRYKMITSYHLVKGPDNKDYVELTNFQLNYEVRGLAKFNLTNLFNGNDQLSNRMLSFLNEHWKPVTAVFGQPIVNAAAKVIEKNVQAFFKHVALSDIAEY